MIKLALADVAADNRGPHARGNLNADRDPLRAGPQLRQVPEVRLRGEGQPPPLQQQHSARVRRGQDHSACRAHVGAERQHS